MREIGLEGGGVRVAGRFSEKSDCSDCSDSSDYSDYSAHFSPLIALPAQPLDLSLSAIIIYRISHHKDTKILRLMQAFRNIYFFTRWL